MKNILEIMTPGQILSTAVALLLAAAGVIVTVGNAVEKIAKVIKAARAPNEAQNAEIRKLDERLTKVEKHLDNDNNKIKRMDTEHQAVLKALVALLDHGLNGNNVEQMQEAKKALINSITDH